MNQASASESERWWQIDGCSDLGSLSYPQALVHDVVATLHRGKCVLDVSCGTGILSQSMCRCGAKVVGLHPDATVARMARLNGLEIEAAAFEEWDPRGRMFDEVVCAEAWNWIDAPSMIQKAAALLKPESRLCMTWTLGHHESPLADALRTAYSRALPFDHGAVPIGIAADSSQDRVKLVGPVGRSLQNCASVQAAYIRTYPWSHVYDTDEWLTQLRDRRDVSRLSSAQRDQLLDEVGLTIDRFGGKFQMALVTILISAESSAESC